MRWKKRGMLQWGVVVGLLVAISYPIGRCTVALTAHTIPQLLEERMKRLTEYVIPETGFSVASREKYKRVVFQEMPSVEKVYNRLKKIEDILGDEYDLDHLRDLIQADLEGRCVVLTCKNCL